MVIKQNLALGLQKSIGDLWKGEDFSDFTVNIEGKAFQCHRFILSACSAFFQGLFRSNMKECQENRTDLGGMTASTFNIVLNSLYKGVDGLTEDNVLDVWSATVQLQIGYLTEECKDFVIKNISVDTCFRFLKHAVLLSEEIVINNSLDFIIKNFKNVEKSESLLQLPFDHFYKIIQSDNLTARSEDSVLETVIKWVEYTPLRQQCSDRKNYDDAISVLEKIVEHNTIQSINSSCCDTKNNEENDAELTTSVVQDGCALFEVNSNRSNGSLVLDSKSNNMGEIEGTALDNHMSLGSLHINEGGLNERNDFQATLPGLKPILFQLVSACKFFVISPSCLENLLKNSNLVLSCRKTYNLILESVMYGLCVERRHDAWPVAAVHRFPSSKKHVMAFLSNGKLMAYNLNTDSVSEITALPEDLSRLKAATVFDNIVYLMYQSYENDYVFVMFEREKKWTTVIDGTLAYSASVLLPCKSSIYGISDNDLMRSYVNHGNDRNFATLCTLPSTGDALVNFQKFLLIFYTQDNAVVTQCYNTNNGKLHIAEKQMDGTSQQMTSFYHQEDVFILQRNGSLWKIVSSDKSDVDFDLISKLWDHDYNLRGGIVYRKQLFVFFHSEQPLQVEFSLAAFPGIFDGIKAVTINSSLPSMPIIAPAQWLTRKA